MACSWQTADYATRAGQPEWRAQEEATRTDRSPLWGTGVETARSDLISEEGKEEAGEQCG